MPAWIAWYRNAVWIASRTGSLPRNENETFDTPPRDLRAAAGSRLIQRVASMKSTRVVVVLLDAGGDREDVRVEDDVLGREADLVDEEVVGALRRSRSCARACRPGPSRRRPSRPPRRRSGAPASPGAGTRPRLPSCEIELTMPLPCTHFRPGLDHAPLRAVDHDRHARDVGLGGDQVQEASSSPPPSRASPRPC